MRFGIENESPRIGKISLQSCQRPPLHNRTDAQLKKTIQKLDNIGIQLGDLGLVQGEVAEDLFFRNLRGVFKKAGIDLRKVKSNLKRKGESEFDLVAENGGVFSPLADSTIR